MKNWPGLFILLILAMKVPAATWYVDSSVATSGNGTAWATAWKALSNITGVKAGDTVYISGGAGGSSQTYSVSSWIPAGGAAGSPIIYQIGQDSAHNGTAVFSGSGTWFGGANNVIVSGDAGDGARHFSCSGYGKGANVNATSNLRISYVNLGSQLSAGVEGQGVSAFEFDHCYAYISDGTADHFMSVGVTGTTWDQNLIHDNTVYIPHQSGAAGDGADGYQIGGNGFDLYNNLLVGYNTTYTGGQHQDGWQGLTNSYVKFYGNTFVDIGNYALFADAYYGGFNHIRAYNNLFLIDDPTITSVNPGGIVFGTDGGYVGPSPCTFNDIIFANNVADGYGNNGSYTLNNVTGSSHPTTFSGGVIINNVSVNGGYISTDGNTTSTVINNATLTTAQGAADFVKYTANGGTNNDFHLLAAASALIGHATNEWACFTTDRDGKPRPVTGNWDMGPYQYALITNPLTPVLQVTPGSVTYGTILKGTSATNSITVANVGTGTLSGTVSMVGGPFSILSGGSYNLRANQSQTVAVVFSPGAATNYNQTATFTGGSGTNVTVSGSATNVTLAFGATSPPMITTKSVAANITNPITLQFTTNLSSPTWQTIGAFTGSMNLSFTNMPAVFIRGVCSNLTSSVTLTWPQSTSLFVVGYKVYYGTASGTYPNVIDVGNATKITIPNLTSGATYYFTIRTYSLFGLVSSYSSEISAVAPQTSFLLTIGDP